MRNIEPTLTSETLRLRILHRLGRFRDAQSIIASQGAALLANASIAERAVFSALAGRIWEVAGSNETAAEWYGRAYELSLSGNDIELDAEVQLFFALSAYSKGDMARSEMHIASVLRSRQPWLQALGYSLRATVATAEGKHEAALASFETALLLFATERTAADRVSEASCLRNYVLSVYSLNRPASALAALSCYDNFPWHADLSKQRHTISILLAELFASFGDAVRTYRLLRDSEESAPDLPALLSVHSLRCAYAHRGGERMFAMNEMSAALRIFESADWSAPTADCRLALLEFARASSSQDPKIARRVLERYASLAPKHSAFAAGGQEMRIEANEKLSFGVVALAEGRHEEGVSLLQEGLRLSEHINHHFLASRIRSVLASLREVPVVAEDLELPAKAQRETIEQFLPAETKRVG